MGRLSRTDRIPVPDFSEGIQIKTEDEDPRFNDALARGLALLRAFSPERWLLGNQELAEATGLAKSTVSRLAYTLTRLGYLQYLPEYGKYELAAGVVGLAYPYLVHQVVPPIARPLMAELAAKTKTNVGLGVHEGLSVYYLEYEMGEIDPNRLQRAGFRVPLVRTALGRACIAGLGDERRGALYGELQTYYRKEWPSLRQELDDAVRQVRDRGFCFAVGTFNATASAVAVPFVYGDGRRVMAINSQGRKATQSTDVLARNGRRLLVLAEELRRRLADAPANPLPRG